MDNINDILFKEMLEDKEIKQLAISLGKAINKKAEQIYAKLLETMSSLSRTNRQSWTS